MNIYIRFHSEYGSLVSWSGFRSSVIKEKQNSSSGYACGIISGFLRYYDQMDDEIKELIPLKKIWVVNNTED